MNLLRLLFFFRRWLQYYVAADGHTSSWLLYRKLSCETFSTKRWRSSGSKENLSQPWSRWIRPHFLLAAFWNFTFLKKIFLYKLLFYTIFQSWLLRMTINSLFIIATNDLKVFMEKHWCSAIKRSVLDDFLEQVRWICFFIKQNHFLASRVIRC